MYKCFYNKKAPLRVLIYLHPHSGIGIGRCFALIIAPVFGSSRVHLKIIGQTQPHLEQIVVAIRLISI